MSNHASQMDTRGDLRIQAGQFESSSLATKRVIENKRGLFRSRFREEAHFYSASILSRDGDLVIGSSGDLHARGTMFQAGRDPILRAQNQLQIEADRINVMRKEWRLKGKGLSLESRSVREQKDILHDSSLHSSRDLTLEAGDLQLKGTSVRAERDLQESAARESRSSPQATLCLILGMQRVFWFMERSPSWRGPTSLQTGERGACGLEGASLMRRATGS